MQWIFHIGIAQSIFSAFILFTKKNKSQADRIMAFWMIFIAMELIHMLLEIQESSFHGFTSNFGFYSLTFGPFLYLYVVKLTQKNPKFKLKDLVHFIPYIVFSIWHFAFFTNQPLKSDIAESSTGWFVLNILRVIVLFISMGTYSYLSIKIIIKHKKSIKDNYSFESSKITLSWLSQIILIFITTYAILIINFLTGNLVQSLVDTSHLIPAFGLTLFCFSLSYFSFNQPVLYQEATSDPSINESQSDQVVLNSDRKEDLMKNLNVYLKTKKPYLNPELTIQELAEGLKLPRHYITEVLKSQLNKNFFTLVNDYRIDEVKSRLASKAYNKLSVLQIALDSGFNSKSSFNAIFKQYTGMTPSEYRKNPV